MPTKRSGLVRHALEVTNDGACWIWIDWFETRVQARAARNRAVEKARREGHKVRYRVSRWVKDGDWFRDQKKRAAVR